MKLDVENIKKEVRPWINFFKQKKVQWVIVAIILLVVLIWSSSIRLENLPLLKDQTTGEYIPLALDPFYFLRMAQTMEQGGLSQYDPLRGPFNVGWVPEILPNAVVAFHKIANLFGNYSLQYIDVLSPIIFYILGLIVFFFLAFLLTKSKTAATVSSIFLAFIPTYLYRSMAGFADHETIGMFSFFLTLIPLILLLKNIEREDTSEKEKIKKLIIFSSILGLLTTLTVISWGGISKFILMVVPISFLLFWLINDYKLSKNRQYLVVGSYLLWGMAGIIGGVFARYGAQGIFGWFTSGTEGLLFLFVLGFLIIDFVLKNYLSVRTRPKKYRIIFSFILVIILGFILLPLLGMNPFSLISEFFSKLIHPFGIGRVGLTVAENKQPFLEDWTSQIGPRFFWIFLLGSLLLGSEISKGLKEKKWKIGFVVSWIILILGISLSRISPTSLLNGTNLLSKGVYFGGIIIFFIFALNLYFKRKIDKIDGRLIIFGSLLLPMLIGTRGAVRLFFVITPITCLMVGYGFDQLITKFRESKEDLLKLIYGGGTIIILILLVISFNFFSNTISAQAQSIGPSANTQWQKAMEWARDYTPQDAVFVHWWDYGYWVEYLGERKTIADGGHFQGDFRDHMIGRYVLTNPDPNRALSFMKTNGVSYLLIDQTDLGKYSAYSSIGSDATGDDRNSWIPIMVNNPAQMQETQNSTIRIYSGGSVLDKDIIYSEEGQGVFLPEGKAAIFGVILDVGNKDENPGLGQPLGVYSYNGQQIRLPIRNLYINGQFIDFGSGVNATAMIIPSAQVTGNSISVDNLGALIYLSEKTKDSLFSQLYLMGDPNNKYPTLTLDHSEPDPIVESLKLQGAQIGDFIYYQGFRGPIKIWKVDYPGPIIKRDEFLRTQGNWGEFDNLTVTLD